MGSSIPYVTQEDKKLLGSYETVASAYARSINKNSAEWNGKDMRGFIDFLWKTKSHRVNVTTKRWMRTCDVHVAETTRIAARTKVKRVATKGKKT